MEILMEFSFTTEKAISNPRFITNILIYWHLRYKVDGFHLIGEGLPIDYILKHPKLSDVKIFYEKTDERGLSNEDHNAEWDVTATALILMKGINNGFVSFLPWNNGSGSRWAWGWRYNP